MKQIYVDTAKNLWPAAAKNLNQHLSKLKREKRIIDQVESEQVMWKFQK